MTRKLAVDFALAIALSVTYAHSAQAQSATKPANIAPLYKLPVTGLDSPAPVPGTINTASTAIPKLRSSVPFKVSVEPGYQSLWDNNPPLASSKYGVAPAAVTLHFSHKAKAQD